jgi:hypothetical protein
MSPALRAFVGAFRATTFRSASGASVCSERALAAARAAAGAARYDTVDLAHRGRYERSDDPIPGPVAAELLEIASAAAGRPLALRDHAMLRMRAGDYSLRADDAAWTGRLGSSASFFDLTLDLSAVTTGEAEVVFTHGDIAYFTVAQRPGQLGMAERTTATGRYDRYLTHRVGEAVVVRLRVLLA